MTDSLITRIAAGQGEDAEVLRPEGHCADDAAWRDIEPQYRDRARVDLVGGDLTDFQLANEIYMADYKDMGAYRMLALQTAAKDRIRWLSVQLAILRTKENPDEHQ